VAGLSHGTTASGGECSGRLRDREEQREPAVLWPPVASVAGLCDDARRLNLVFGIDAFTWRPGASGALGIAEGGEKHVLGVARAAEKPRCQRLLEDLFRPRTGRQRRILVVMMARKRASRCGTLFSGTGEVPRCDSPGRCEGTPLGRRPHARKTTSRCAMHLCDEQLSEPKSLRKSSG